MPIAIFVAAITLVGLPLSIALGLAALPFAAIAYVTAAWALGRVMVKPPQGRILAFLAGLAILRVAALVPAIGLLVGLAAMIVGLGLLGGAIAAARQPAAAVPRAAEDRQPRVARVLGLGPGAQAEREDRAPGVGDKLLVDALVAETAADRSIAHTVKLAT